MHEHAFYTSSVGAGIDFISKIEALCAVYRGRTTFAEMMDMPLSYINVLFKLAEEKAKSEEGKKQMEGEALEDGMEELVSP